MACHEQGTGNTGTASSGGGYGGRTRDLKTASELWPGRCGRNLLLSLILVIAFDATTASDFGRMRTKAGSLPGTCWTLSRLVSDDLVLG